MFQWLRAPSSAWAVGQIFLLTSYTSNNSPNNQAEGGGVNERLKHTVEVNIKRYDYCRPFKRNKKHNCNPELRYLPTQVRRATVYLLLRHGNSGRMYLSMCLRGGLSGSGSEQGLPIPLPYPASPLAYLDRSVNILNKQIKITLI